MLNRAERRKVDKKMKRQLTREQYEELKQDSVNATISLEVDRQVKNMFDVIMKNIVQAMRENRISDERLAKIMSRVVELSKGAQ